MMPMTGLGYQMPGFGLLGGLDEPPGAGLFPVAQQQGAISLTPQMIQQILQQRALMMQPRPPVPGAPQIGTLTDLQNAQQMMGVGGVRR